MAIKDITVGYLIPKTQHTPLSVLITAECPRKPDGCDGEVFLHAEYVGPGGREMLSSDFALRWFNHIAPCSDCGTAFGLPENSEMWGYVIQKVKDKVAELRKKI